MAKNKNEAQAPEVAPASAVPAEPSPSFEDKVAAAVAKALAVAMPEMAKQMGMTQMAVEAAKNQTAHDKLVAEHKKKEALQERCSVCRQVVGDGKGRGCGGPYRRDAKGEYVLDAEGRRIEDPDQFHTKMVVYPKDPVTAEWFPFVKVNGVEYYSQGPGHEIYVPKQNDIASQLAIFEEQARIERVGRKHIRKNGGTTSNPAPIGVGFTG